MDGLDLAVPDLSAAEIAAMSVELWEKLGNVVQVYSLAHKWFAAPCSKCASSTVVFDAFWDDCMLLHFTGSFGPS